MAVAVVAAPPLTQIFAQIPDPRRAQGTRHPLPGVLALACVAIMCGCRSLLAVAQWGEDHGGQIGVKLGLKEEHGTPVVSTLHELFKRLDVPAFEQALSRWAAAWVPQVDQAAQQAQLEPICIDGKTLRGSQGHQLPGVHLLAAYATRLGIVLAQVPAGANKQEGGEITAAPQLLKELVLQGKLITGDAIHAQRQLCRQIVRGGGQYLLTVKENQPKLHLELVDLFRSPCAPLLPAARRTSTAAASSSGRCGSAGS